MTSDSRQIEIGDAVRVVFSSHPPIQGIVTYRPQATGDSWHVETDQTVFYVQQFDYMEKRHER